MKEKIRCLCGNQMRRAMTSKYHVLYECPQCFKLRIIGKNTGMQSWYSLITDTGQEDYEEVESGRSEV